MTGPGRDEVEVQVASWVTPGWPQLCLDLGQSPPAHVVMVHPEDVARLPKELVPQPLGVS